MHPVSSHRKILRHHGPQVGSDDSTVFWFCRLLHRREGSQHDYADRRMPAYWCNSSYCCCRSCHPGGNIAKETSRHRKCVSICRCWSRWIVSGTLRAPSPSHLLTLLSSGAGLGGSYLTSLSVGGWRYIFWIQSAFHGAAFVGFLFFYWPSRRSDYPKMNVKEWLWLCDPIGSFLFITGSTLTLIPLNWAGGKYQWHDPRVYGMLTVGVITLIAFLLYGKQHLR